MQPAAQTVLPRRLRHVAGVAQDNAVMISGVEAGGPADRAGLAAGDIILSLDGAVVAGADDLVRLLTADKIGREVLVETLRKGERRTVALTAQERPRGGRD